jgi:hypothetical protein
MHLPLIRGQYQCAGKGKETLKETPEKETPRIGPMSLPA